MFSLKDLFNQRKKEVEKKIDELQKETANIVCEVNKLKRGIDPDFVKSEIIKRLGSMSVKIDCNIPHYYPDREKLDESIKEVIELVNELSSFNNESTIVFKK